MAATATAATATTAATAAKRRRRRDATRCFALMENGDTTVATCRFRLSKGAPSVSFDKGETFRAVQHVATIAVGGGVTVEVWQRDVFGPETPIDRVWNIPLLSVVGDSRWLLFPVIFRVLAPSSDALPTASRTRKLLAERIAAEGAAEPDDLDEVAGDFDHSLESADDLLVENDDDDDDDVASANGLSDDEDDPDDPDDFDYSPEDGEGDDDDAEEEEDDDELEPDVYLP